MAKLIYREWFVEFNAPGVKLRKATAEEKKVTGKDQFPEGWEVTKLGVHLASIESGKRPKGGIVETERGIPSVGAENVNGIGNHNFGNEKYVSYGFYESMTKGKVQNKDVALYKDGAYIGRSSYFRDEYPHAKFCVNEHVFLLRSNSDKLHQNFLYLWFQEHNTVSAIRATNANAAQPGINQESVKGLTITLPNKIIAKHFDELVDPLIEQIILLSKKNQNLRRTRDLLLPKLVSGEIEV